MRAPTVEELSNLLAQKLPKFTSFFDYQVDAFTDWNNQTGVKRLCLYHRTGAGKSITSLACIALAGETSCLVIAPPATHSQWVELGKVMGVDVTAVSHAKFRMKDFKVSRQMPVICDEFHLLGGAQGKGWKKFSVLAQHIQAPFVICSATPNYNDAERCYCIKYVLDPANTRGGLIQFIYTYCTTEENYFGRIPNVTGFQVHLDAEHFLREMKHVKYLPDEAEYEIVDLPIEHHIPDEFLRYGLSRRAGRIMASGMEARWQRTYFSLLNESGLFRDDVYDLLAQIAGEATTPILVFCASSTVAEALRVKALRKNTSAILVTGKYSRSENQQNIELFKSGRFDLLIGTATLATGVDGIDKMCDTMVIVHDTDDPSLRRQLIGRILPRGEDSDASNKKIYRLVPDVP